jgi:hypothetical protein
VTLAPLKTMWPRYPIGSAEEVAALIGVSVGSNILKYKWDTCCIRLSQALNTSGVPIDGFQNMASPYIGIPKAKVRASRGGDNGWYIYSCYDLRAYLESRFGYAKRFGSFESSALSSERGIIMFGFRHVDLWDGTDVRYNTDFTDGTKTVSEIRVWQTPAGG